MEVTVYIDDFHRLSKSWNRVAEMQLEDFDFSTNYPSRYVDGIVRMLFIREDGKSLSREEAEEFKNKSIGGPKVEIIEENNLTEEILDDKGEESDFFWN